MSKKVILRDLRSLPQSLATEKGQGILAEANKARGGNGNTAPDLPDLDLAQVEVTPLTQEEKDVRIKVAQERRQWAETAAEKLRQVREGIATLEGIAQEGILSPSDQFEIVRLRGLEEQILQAGDDSLKSHRVFTEFVAEIRGTERTAVVGRRFLQRVLDEGRYHVAIQEEHQRVREAMNKRLPAPEGFFFFEGKLYLPSFKDEEKSAGQRAVESELTRFFRELGRIEKHGVARLLDEGDRDLGKLKGTKPGKYVLHFPAHMDKRGTARKEGAVLVSLERVRVGKDKDDEILAIKLVSCAGESAWLERKGHVGKWIPFSWFKNREISDKAKEEDQKFGKLFLGVLGAGLACWYASQKKGEPKTEPEPKPELTPEPEPVIAEV